MSTQMRLTFAFLLGLGGALLSGRAAQAVDGGSCDLPGGGNPITCVTDPECAPYGAICDPASMVCICGATDAGVVTDAATSADMTVQPPPGMQGGAAPGSGGGSGPLLPPRTSGCSFVPGTP
jgi:hypothetical protein